MDYKVSDTQLHQLNQSINIGGHIPSAVSNALAEAQIALAGKNQAALESALNQAIEANKQSGAAWKRIQTWHDNVKDNGAISDSGGNTGNSGGGQQPSNPVTPPGSILEFPVAKVTKNGTRFETLDGALAQGVYYYMKGSGKHKLSCYTASGGYPIYYGFDVNALTTDGTGANWIESPEGDWTYYMMYTGDPGRVQQGGIDKLPV